MAQEYSTKLTLKDNFSAVIRKAISATEALRSKLQETEKDLNKLGNKKVKIKAQLDSSVNSSLNKLADKIPKDKTIHIKAKDEVTRSVTNMKRDIFKMGNDISMGMRDPFRSFSRSAISATGNIGLMRSAAQDLARSMATSHMAAQMTGNAMAASAAAGAAASRVVGAKAGSAKPAFFYKGSGKKGTYPDPDYHESKERYHRLGAGDVPARFNRSSRSITSFDADKADMIERQQKYMKKQFGVAYLKNYRATDEHIGGGDHLRVLNKKLSNSGYAYQRTKEWAGDKLGEAKMKLNLVTSAAESKLNAFKSKISSTKGAEMLVRAKFAGERGMYGLKNMTATIGAKFKDMGASSGINNLWSKAQSLSGKVFSFTVNAKTSAAMAQLEKLKSGINTLGLIGGAAIAGGTMKAITGAATLQSNITSIKHFVRYANTKNVSKGKESKKTDAEIQTETDAYVKKLRKYAVDTPFGDTEVIAAGRRAVNVMGGDLKDAEELVKIAGDMAALTPGKTIMDALEALADLKVGETERAKEFGLKISAKQFKALVGKGEKDDLTEEEQLQAYRKLMKYKLKTLFGGGAKELSKDAKGKWSTLTGTIESGFTDIGTKFLPGIEKGLDKIIATLDKAGPQIIAAFEPLAAAFNSLIDNPLFSGENVLMVAGITAAVLAVSALCAVVMAVVFPIITVVGWIGKLVMFIGPLARGLALVRTAMLGVNLAMLMNPVGLVIAGIAALIAIGVAMYVYWDEIKQFFLDMWVGPSQVISQFIAFLQEAFNVGFNFLLNNAKIILQFFSDLWYNPEAAFDNYLANVKGNFGAVADWLISKWQAVCDFFSSNVPSVNADVSWDASAGLNTGDGGSERAVGMEYIPYNGYQISAHRGEAILTRTEADQWRAGNSGGAGGVVINIHDPVVREESDLDRLGTMLASKIIEVRGNMGAVPA